MPLFAHGTSGSARGVIAALRLVATDRGRRPFAGGSAELVRAMGAVAVAVQGEGMSLDIEDLLGSDEPWVDDRQAAAAIAEWLPESDQRREAVHASLLVPLGADLPDPAGLHAARWLAIELGADDQTIRDLEATSSRNAARAETDLFRRFLAWKTGIDQEVIAARMDRHEVPVLTSAQDVDWLRRMLESAKEGTVAADLARFYSDTGFDLPGTPGVLPLEVLGSHDVHHVLTAYDASPEDEVYLAVFNAANAVNGGMDYLAVIMLQWHQGIRLGVFNPARARIDPELVAAAALRGERTSTDVSALDWDYQALLSLSLDEARGSLGLPPGGSVGPNGRWDASHHMPH